MTIFIIRGAVRELETGVGLPGLYVKAYDKDLVYDDLLGTARTGGDGSFEIRCDPADFRDLFEKRPDIYLRVFGADTTNLLHSTDSGVRWRSGRVETFDVRVPASVARKAVPTQGLRLVDDRGEARTEFDAGESFVLGLDGLRPHQPHEVRVLDASGAPLVASTLRTDARGALRPFDLWPLAGLHDPRSGEAYTLAEAEDRWRGQRLRIEVLDGTRRVSEVDARFADDFRRPLVVPVGPDQRVLTGFEVGEREVRVTVRRPPGEHARVFMVPRQHDWRVGDPFTPVQLRSRRAAFADLIPDERGGYASARVARAREIEPGAYDFVVRPIRYGYEDDEDLVLRATDVVGHRRATGLVVRLGFMRSKTVRGGCVNTATPISGRYIGGRPYFQFSDVFQVGEDVWGALDPAALDPALLGRRVAFYVVRSKDQNGWNADKSLQHLPELGGNAAVQQITTVPGCINCDRLLLWDNASVPGTYDIVADFGADPPDPLNFTPDGQLSPPKDLIDGYFMPGFRVVADPGVHTTFPHQGGTVVQTGTTVSAGWYQVPIRYSLHFPTDASNVNDPSGISAAQPSYPLVVLVHGNSSAMTGYLGYEYLLEHLARNGFIAASIHLEPGQGIDDRVTVLLAALDDIKQRLGSRVQNAIGLMGHSRGGEAVVRAAQINQQQGGPHVFKSLIALAPTDFGGVGTFTAPPDTPLFVLYGSMDGDVAGVQQTGFSLYDRAVAREKSMVFVHGATHARFNTEWGDVDVTAWWSKLTSADHPKLLAPATHLAIAKTYMTAWFRKCMFGERQWDGIFRGEWVPSMVQQAEPNPVKLYTQYQAVGARVVDDFEGAHSSTSWQTSTIGGAVDDGNTLPSDPIEGQLKSIDPHSPHDTGGLQLRWDGTGDRLEFAVPAAQRDVSGFAVLSFRIGQKVGSTSNPAGTSQDLYVTLRDVHGNSRAIRVGAFAEVPPPHARGNAYLTKSALRTVRVPLSSYQIEVVGTQRVDLTAVTQVAFEFQLIATGEVAIDNVEFSS